MQFVPILQRQAKRGSVRAIEQASRQRGDLHPALGRSRYRFLEALHIPAAVIALEDGRLTVTAANRAYHKLDPTGASIIGALSAPVRAFLRSARGRETLPFGDGPGESGHFDICLSRLPPSGDLTQQALLSMVDRTAEVETERTRRAEMLRDGLTGLPNRRAFAEAVDQAIGADGAQERFALLAVDLVRFSRINECVGALAGDEVILIVAHRLASVLRDGDVLARLGGDEFGVLLRLNDGPGDALHAARRLQAALADPIRVSDLDVKVECAIGCALWSDTAPTAVDVMRNVQIALKRAKVSGHIEVDQPGEVSRARRRLSIESDLRRAIEQDRLNLEFQPLLDLATGNVTGFEALARWAHPDHGPISPVEFIPVAEESGLIVPLGRWALAATARALREWDDGGLLPQRIAVNVSPVQLRRDSLARAVEESGIDPARLTLELTESAIVAEPERAARVLGALHDRGCHVAMDDFGTGYSSLAYLQKLPIDVLKIDRSFVMTMRDNRDSAAIVRAVLSLTRSLGMSTIAEGIETEEIARELTELGCPIGQGFFFARPLEAAAAIAYLRARNA